VTGHASDDSTSAKQAAVPCYAAVPERAGPMKAASLQLQRQRFGSCV
jgi:hypothetical protein